MRKLRFVFLNNNRIDARINVEDLRKLNFIDMVNLCDNPISSLVSAKLRSEVIHV